MYEMTTAVALPTTQVDAMMREPRNVNVCA